MCKFFTHFLVSMDPPGCLFPIYPPKYPFITLCVLCVTLVVRFKVCLRTMQRFFPHCCSCVTSMIGKRSLAFTSLLLPANATHRPGIVPFSHASLRSKSVCPSQFRNPLQRSLNSLAMPLQTRRGPVIHEGDTRFVHGASCLHSFGLRFDRHALGTMRLPFGNNL